MKNNLNRELLADVAEKLIFHLQERNDVQNIDLMNLSGFCRNCISKWYTSSAKARNIDIDIADKSDEWDAFSTAGTTLDGAVGINVGTLQFFNKKRTGSAEPNDGSYTYTTTWTASEWLA